jgi:hypothetical protein
LVALAQATRRPEVVWRRDRPLVQATNAHRTNTVDEMRAALRSNATQFECDLRGAINPPHEVECRHDAGQEPGDNLDFSEWLAIGKASGRVLKLDVKEPQYLGQILDQVQAAGIPPERLNINLGDAAMAQWGDEIRRRFPTALLSINPGGSPVDGHLSDAQVARLVQLARRFGAPSTFVVRLDLLSDANVRTLEAVAPVSVWNDPGQAGVTDPAKVVASLKARGCTGVLDVRRSDGAVQKTQGVLSHLEGLLQGLWGRVSSALH